MKIIAVGPNSWGKGASIDEAVDNLWPHLPSAVTDPKRGPRPGVAVAAIWLVPDDARVDDFGAIWASWDGDAEQKPIGYLDRLRKVCRAPAS